MEEKEEAVSNQDEINCKGCGASLVYKPGTSNLVCQFCGAENPIENATTEIKENDFYAALEDLNNVSEKHTVTVVKCSSCAAEVTLDPNIFSEDCPFCGTPIVAEDKTTSDILKPKALLPFNVENNKAYELFKKWINGLWWAPNDLKKYVIQKDKLAGIYMPFWTYDADTTSSYIGQRGKYYTETYTVTVDGKTQTRTRTKTRWYSASGTVNVPFDDTLVRGSNSLPVKLLEKLEPWDLPNLTPYNDKYLSGFRTEKYQIDLKEGFKMAKNKMASTINTAIKRDIGGDTQRIFSVNTSYNNISFKHILLPVWVSSYIYNSKTYNFMINARTGEVQGERPYSWIKITLAVLAVAVVGVGIWYFNKS